MQWRSPVFRTFCFQRSATAASFTSVCVSRQTALLGTSGLMISFRASGIVPQLSAVRTPICPFENCIQSWTERLAPFGQSVLHLRWNFGVCGAMHNAISLHAFQLLPQHLLRNARNCALKVGKTHNLATKEMEENDELPSAF